MNYSTEDTLLISNPSFINLFLSKKKYFSVFVFIAIFNLMTLSFFVLKMGKYDYTKYIILILLYTLGEFITFFVYAYQYRKTSYRFLKNEFQIIKDNKCISYFTDDVCVVIPSANYIMVGVREENKLRSELVFSNLKEVETFARRNWPGAFSTKSFQECRKVSPSFKWYFKILIALIIFSTLLPVLLISLKIKAALLILGSIINGLCILAAYLLYLHLDNKRYLL